MTANREFAGRRALVTGGTKGIGQAVAAKLREAGATVLITARTRGGAGLDDHHFVAADVTTAAGCASVADAVRDRLGGIDIIIHVVGGSSAPAGGFAVDPTELVRTFTSPQRASRMNGYLSTCGAAPYWPPIPDAWSEEIVSAISSVVTIALA
jgi:NAD(P)-dependent dehydrogenase (short-subunit alcohol dehydrogenase family)